MRVELPASDTTLAFGTFGHCALIDNGDDYCSGKHIGYNPAKIIEAIDNSDFSTASTNTSKALTRVMVLHPVACVLAFIAFILSAGAGVIGAVSAALVAATAWVVTVIVMATDFVLFGLVKKHANDEGNGSKANFAVGMWTLVAAMICLFFACIVVLLTCCSSRMHRQNHTSKHAESGYAHRTTTTRRHFWQRRTRY